MSKHLEVRNTPYGRILIAIEPEAEVPEKGPPVEDDDVRTSPRPPKPAVADASGVATTIRAALSRIARRTASPLDDQKHHLHTETQEIMDRVSTAIDSLFDDYMQHLNEADVDACAPASHHEESPDVQL